MGVYRKGSLREIIILGTVFLFLGTLKFIGECESFGRRLFAGLRGLPPAQDGIGHVKMICGLNLHHNIGRLLLMIV